MKLLIKIAGQTVDVSPDTAINLVRKSPVFQRDEIIGDYAEEINLPFTLQNDKILGYFRHPQSATAIQRMYCEQYVNTNMLTRGYVLPMEAIDNYRLAYTSGLADAFGNIRTKSLRGIDFGSIALPTNYNNTLTNTYQNGGFVFPCIWSPEFYQNPPEGFNGKINEYNNGYTTGPKVPMFFVRYILEQIASLTGFVFSFDTPEINNWIIYNIQSLDSLGTILPQNHLPDLTVGQFLLEFAKLTNSALFFDVPNRTLQFKTRKSVYQSECTLDWSKKASPIKGKIPFGSSGLELLFTEDSDDGVTKLMPLESYLSTGANEDITKIETVWSTLPTVNGLPYTLQQGITVGQNDKTFSPRLLQWSGLQNGVPLAKAETNSLELFWTTNNGLFKRYYQEEEWLNQNTFIIPPVTLYLTESDLAQWTPDQKVHINGVNYLFDQIECPLHNLSQGCIGTAYRVY